MKQSKMYKVEVMGIEDLHPDPKNERERTPRSEGLIVTSLQSVGPWRSIALDEKGTCYAGNGVLSAAAEVGIERVMVIEPPPNTIVAVRKSGLTESQKRQYAVLDNRISDLSGFDAHQFLSNATEFQFDPINLGFTEDEIAALGESVMGSLADAQSAAPDPEKELELVVTCKDFDDQQALKERLEGEGYKCKARRRKPRKKAS